MEGRWETQPYDVAAARRLGESLDLSRTVATILTRRGLADPVEARRFIEAGDRHDPGRLPGLARASELILHHLRRGSRIVVHGDYDVDGVCSTAILVRALRDLGGAPTWELPSRFDDGYGLSRATVDRMAAAEVGLLVTVDCGITAVAEVAAARAAGIDVVVTDHHRPGFELPDCPVVHPALGDYPCPDLCAAGVALKLSEGLRAAAGQDPRGADADLDLAALATVCDMVPLRDENRRVVREGLAEMARSPKPGLRALMEVATVDSGELTEHSLGFRMGPRINAAGRMQRADAALELLLTDDADRAGEVARELDLLNLDRKEAETRILFAAEAACAPQAHAASMVVAGEGWHPGVVGIVASRLVERWRRPCVVVALDGASGRGSGRSISAYDLHAGLSACADHLTRFGGHRVAAGVELETERLGHFRRALAAHAAAELAPEDLIRTERVDAVVPGDALDLTLADELEALRPFGVGNPQPTLLVPAARVENVTGMGAERKHARFTAATGGSRSRCVAFGSSPGSLAPLAAGGAHDLALRLELNRWNGAVEPRAVLRAGCPTPHGRLNVLGEDGGFWTRYDAEMSRDPVATPSPVRRSGAIEDRRGAGFTGVAGDLLTSGESVIVAVADVARRRAGLESVVAGLAEGGLEVVSWLALAANPGLAHGRRHLLALDPPPAGAADPLLGAGDWNAHMAWGDPESAFALEVWRAELDLRPAVADAWRALVLQEPRTSRDAVRIALAGSGRYPRTPECCARIALVLSEVDLVELGPSGAGVPVRTLDPRPTDLARSAAFRAYGERWTEIERALGPMHAPVAALA